jgi:hypothetical protein
MVKDIMRGLTLGGNSVATVAEEDFFTHLASLPTRKGKRPITIRGPLHLQYSDTNDPLAPAKYLRKTSMNSGSTGKSAMESSLFG